ncbi:hypothetical protein TUBRATIS_006790 [Tubulinosema ratisbonensis]|uniref:Uncharacterized protein n=1 Tax=Tubulinosema ratisbonensis TaxID=291195 RepID=A0A437AP80_9MICR|nr:hypothetical protein TUBRATIS_006790 [Tubulinosema ratisbonensis]
MVNQLNKQINAPSFPVLTIQNKYVQSYFMKNDNSYYTRTDYTYNEKEIILLTYNKIIYKEKSLSHSLFLNLGSNTQKFKSLSSFVDEFENLILKLEIQRFSNIVFVFYDYLTRSEIMGVLDSFLMKLQMKSAMILPFSLMVSVSLTLNNCISMILCDDGAIFGYIDDNCLLDIYRLSSTKEFSYGFKVMDEEDFSEEFSKKNGDQKFICDLCHLVNFYDKMSEHFKIEHFGKDTFDKENLHIIPIETKEEDEEIKKENSQKSRRKTKGKERKISEEDKVEPEKVKKKVFPSQESFLEIEHFDFLNQVLYLLKKYVSVSKNDKNKKVINVLVSIQSNSKDFSELIKSIKESVEGNVLVVEECENKAIIGANMICSVETAKELWISDQEWCDFKLRILKEKVLFNI